MRDIKFRGLRLDGEEFAYGYYFEYKGSSVHQILTSERVCVVIPNTIGQFTGLQDKKGIGIYEGDVLKITGSDGSAWKTTVIFDGINAIRLIKLIAIINSVSRET